MCVKAYLLILTRRFHLFLLGTNDEYEIGDLSGKYGSFHNYTYYNKKHVDFNLPLFGKNSIHGRSIVIHKMKVMGSGRWVCADNPAVWNNEMFVMKTKVNFNGPALKGYILLVSYLVLWLFFLILGYKNLQILINCSLMLCITKQENREKKKRVLSKN